MRGNPQALTGGLLLWQLLFPAWLCAQDAARWPPSMVESASLHAVACIDAETAWAIGERGAILSTTDGGATWTQQAGRTTEKPLYGVSFADRQHGIIVGGDARPYQLPSAGIILRTRDAGQTWESAERTMLPQLKRVAHTDLLTAIAIGDSSPLFLSGIFRTVDGGRSWNCIPTRNMQNWENGDVTNPEQLLLTSGEGKLARCAASRVVDSTRVDEPPAEWRDAAWISAEHAIAVGSQGALLESLDQGRTWQPLASLTKYPLSQQFDFRTVWAKQGCIWIAGSPGTHIFRSVDDGQTWDAAETGQSLPLNCLDFSDPQHGFAVGDFGVILVTRDGGRTWNVTRGRDYRAGVLLVCQTCADIPFDLIAQLSSTDQLRCHVAVAEASAAQLRQGATAARLAGADNVERLSRGPAAALTAQLMRRLLAYRPEIVVVADGEGGRDGRDLLLPSVKAAIQVAGDRERLVSSVGRTFSPWRVKRLFHTVASVHSVPASLTIDTAAPILPLKSSICAALMEAYSFLEHPHSGPVSSSPCGDPTKGTSLVCDAVGTEPPADAPCREGLQLPFDSQIRRPLAPAPADDVWLRRQATAYHSTVSLLERAVRMGDGAGVEQLVPLTRDLPSDNRTLVLMWAVRRCRQQGRSALAQQMLDAVLQMQSHDVHETAAVLARFRLSTSAELQHFSRGTSVPQTPNPARTRGDRVEPASDVVPGDPSSEDVRRPETHGLSRAVQAMLEQLPPDVTTQPSVQLAMASVRRRAADPQDRQRIYKLLQSKVASAEWRRCVAIEAWLADLQPDPRRPVPPDVVYVPQANVPPMLDGKLDESAWRDAASLKLASPPDHPSTSRLATVVRVTRDAKYLFVALSCEGGPPAPKPAQRAVPRDADLRAVDHVDLCLDVNRDYSSGWQISVDCRGSAGDWVDVDPTWNPKWYLASGRHASGWIAELAIPLSELTTQMPLTDRCSSTWLVGIRRTAGDAYQTWPSGAGAELRWQRCGYLVLDDGHPSRSIPQDFN